MALAIHRDAEALLAVVFLRLRVLRHHVEADNRRNAELEIPACTFYCYGVAAVFLISFRLASSYFLIGKQVGHKLGSNRS